MGAALPCGGAVRVGADLQGVDEVESAVARFGHRYLDRVYTPAEQAAAARDSGSTASALAARFAAKEAVLKLVGSADGIDPRTVELLGSPSGRHSVRLSGTVAALAEDAGIGSIDVSLSHTARHAVAVAVALVSADRRCAVPEGLPT